MPPYKDRLSLAVKASVTDSEPVLPLARAPAAQSAGRVAVLTWPEGPFRPIPDAGIAHLDFPFEPDKPHHAVSDALGYEQGTHRRDEGEASCHRRLRHHVVLMLPEPRPDSASASDPRMPRQVFLTPVREPNRGILVIPRRGVPGLESCPIHVAPLSGDTGRSQSRRAERHISVRCLLFRGGGEWTTD